LYSCSQRNHPEDGHKTGRNVLVTIIQYEHINKIKVNLLVFNTVYAKLTEFEL